MYVQPPALPDSTQIDHHQWLVVAHILQITEQHRQEIMVGLELILAFVRGGNIASISRIANVVKGGKKTQVLPRVCFLMGLSPKYGSHEHPRLQGVMLVNVCTHLVSIQVYG
jgi:hypothetical protein